MQIERQEKKLEPRSDIRPSVHRRGEPAEVVRCGPDPDRPMMISPAKG